MKPVLLKGGDGNPLLIDADYLMKVEHTDNYGPSVQSRIWFHNGYDAFVSESVEEINKLIIGAQ